MIDNQDAIYRGADIIDPPDQCPDDHLYRC